MISLIGFHEDANGRSPEEKKCYCGKVVRYPRFVYDKLVFCSHKHLEIFKSSRVDPLCGLILPFDPLQGVSLKDNISLANGIIVDRKKYVFCTKEHRDVFVKRNELMLDSPKPDKNRRGFLKLAGGVGTGLAAAFAFGRLSIPASAQQTNSDVTGASFGANGVGLPSLASDPSPLPPDGYLWYRSDLKVVRTASNGSAVSLGSRPFISVSPNGPDVNVDYGANTTSTSTDGLQEAANSA